MHKIISATIFLLISKFGFASCFIEEVVDFHDSGQSAREIRNECDGKVDESDCSIGKIIGYAKDGERLSSILKRCEIKDN